MQKTDLKHTFLASKFPSLYLNQFAALKAIPKPMLPGFDTVNIRTYFLGDCVSNDDLRGSIQTILIPLQTLGNEVSILNL
jgi:hypothetical protein